MIQEAASVVQAASVAAALTARLSLDDHDRTGARAHAIELITDRREFSIATADNGSRRRHPAQMPDDRRGYAWEAVAATT